MVDPEVNFCVPSGIFMGVGDKKKRKRSGRVDLEPIWTSAPPGRRGDAALKGDTSIAPVMRAHGRMFSAHRFKRVGTQTVRPYGVIPAG